MVLKRRLETVKCWFVTKATGLSMVETVNNMAFKFCTATRLNSVEYVVL